MVDRLCPKSTPPLPATAAPANAATRPDPPRERWSTVANECAQAALATLP
jgi:hypothetical protein